MMKLSKDILKVLVVCIFVWFVNVSNVYGQAPDCDICNQILENGDPSDPQVLVDYGICMEENCDGSIPIDSHIWLIILGGVTIVYVYYKKKALDYGV